MRPDDSKKALTKRLDATGLRLERVSAIDAIDAMLAFYAQERAKGCDLAADGDMLLFQWGTYSRAEGATFILNLSRQFITGAGEDDDISQLQLSYVHAAEPELTGLGSGEFWCSTPEEIAEFGARIFQSAPLRSSKLLSPATLTLIYERVG